MVLRRCSLALLAMLLLPAVAVAVHQEPDGGDGVQNLLKSVGLQREGGSSELYAEALARLDERLASYPQDHEASLLKALLEFKSGLLNEALGELQGLTRREPKFHLAHLIRGDLLLASTRVVSDIGSPPFSEELEREGGQLAQLREEAEVRLQSYLDTLPQGRLPRALLLLGDEVQSALLVDKASHRLYLYRRGADGAPELLRDFYVSTGKASGNKHISGDLRTPEGVYFITRHIPDERLPDLYGVSAYPMNYPNEWDRRLGKSGYGIWLHGTKAAYYSRPPLDSEGCVVLPNIDLGAVAPYLQPGTTPIIISDRAQWLEREAWLQLRREAHLAVEQWRADWASGDVDRYLGHYAEAFWSGGQDREGWAVRKRQLAADKQWQRVELDALSLFAYPAAASDGREVVVANFRQRYDSNNFSSEMTKRLYLVREGGQWRVLYEGRQ